MSRKPSKSKISTSTTQRRQNLLRSVTEVRQGRMTTNGLFHLGSQTMTEVDRKTGRTYKNAYFIVRNDLRDVLNKLANPAMIVDAGVLETFYNGGGGRIFFRVSVPAPGIVKIGCKTFTGKAAQALRDWTYRE